LNVGFLNLGKLALRTSRAMHEPAGPVMPVVYDTPWAGVIDALGGVSLRLYARLSRWKREAALARPGESTGFRVVARARP